MAQRLLSPSADRENGTDRDRALPGGGDLRHRHSAPEGKRKRVGGAGPGSRVAGKSRLVNQRRKQANR